MALMMKSYIIVYHTLHIREGKSGAQVEEGNGVDDKPQLLVR